MGKVRQLPRWATVVVKQGSFHANFHMNSASVDTTVCFLSALKCGNFSDCAGRADGTSWQELRVTGILLMEMAFSDSESFQETLAQEWVLNSLHIFQHSGKSAPNIWTTLFEGRVRTSVNAVAGRKKEQVLWQVGHRCDTNQTDFGLQSTTLMAALSIAFSILMCMHVFIRDALSKKPVHHVIERKNELDEYF